MISFSLSTVSCTLLLLLYSTISCAQDKVLLCTGKASHSYHKKYCSGLSQCKSPVIEVSLQSAKDRGRDPCDFCYGRESAAADNNSDRYVRPSVPASKQSNYSGQCRATTKKGTRCSRNASNNGYCWQHG